MVNKNGGTKYDFDYQIRVRGVRGSKDNLSMILEYLTDDFPFDFDITGDIKELFIHRHFSFVLREKGYSEEVIQRIALESIGYFEGIIEAIRKTADIKSVSEPVGEPLFLSSTDEVVALKNAYDDGNDSGNSNRKGLVEKKSEGSAEEAEIRQNFNRMQTMFEVN